MSNDKYRAEQREARQHGLRARQEARLERAAERELANVETVVHRVLAQHAPGEICPECPARDQILAQLARAIDPDIFDQTKKRSKRPAAVIQIAARQHMAYEAAAKVLQPIVKAVDLCWKATPYGETEDGDVAAYILPKGVVHRLVGALQGIGVTAALKAFPSDPEASA